MLIKKFVSISVARIRPYRWKTSKFFNLFIEFFVKFCAFVLYFRKYYKKTSNTSLLNVSLYYLQHFIVTQVYTYTGLLN